jgi:hypothetical protein
MDAEVSTHTFLTKIIGESVCFMSCEPIFLCAIILMWYARNIYIYIFINWTLRMSDNLPEKVQILSRAYHMHYCTGTQNYLLSNILWFAFKICFWVDFNVVQLILVKMKWHIKWKYLIQKSSDLGEIWFASRLWCCELIFIVSLLWCSELDETFQKFCLTCVHIILRLRNFRMAAVATKNVNIF